jgi:molybdate transport system substrate-binding protein
VRRLALLTAATAVTATLALSACSSSGSGDEEPSSLASGGGGSSSAKLSGSITVFAASSLTDAFNMIKAQFETAHPGTSVTLTYGASSDLSTQITQGASVDVFASASTKNMDAVVQAKDAANPTDFVSNTAEIAVPPSNPGKITQLSDLAKSGVTVALCDPAVPCGVLTTTIFTNAKISVHPKATEPDVKSTLAAVESNEVDAGIVYVTDVRAAGDKVKGVEIPANLNASTTYPIAALTHAKNAPVARAFVDYVLSSAGQQVLTADGFSKP